MDTRLRNELQSDAFATRVETALHETCSSAFAMIEPRYLLRQPVCELASAALTLYIRYRGTPARLTQSESEALPGVEISHTMIETEEGEIVDPTYSQFLALAGYDYPYIYRTGDDRYPREKIAVFSPDEAPEIVGRLSRVADELHPLVHPNGVGRHQIRDMQPGEFGQALSGIWDTRNMTPYRPALSIQRLGAVAAAKLVDSAPRLVRL